MTGFKCFTELVQSLPATVPFVGPEEQERKRGEPFLARLGANESGFGPSPAVIEALAKEAPDIWKYGDSQNFDLRTALADHLGVDYANLMVGEGVDGLLGLAVRMVVSPGTPVVTSLGAYPTFNYHVAGFGGRLVTVPYREDREDLDGLLEAVLREDAPLVYLSNPDNPMGSWWEGGKVLGLADSLPETTMLVLDEAYCEFAPQGALPAIDSLLARPNVIRMRTFSKAYGLAGMRIGYAIGAPETIRTFDKIRNHFGMSRLSLVAAEAALKDQDYLRGVVADVSSARDRIAEIASASGLKALPSATNFVAIDCGRDGPFARAVLDALVYRGVFVRMPGVAPLDRCIRVSAAPAPELDAFARLLPAALDEAATRVG